MIVARGFAGGEAIEVTKKRQRLNDDELRRLRSDTMKRMKRAGSPVREIAAFFRCTPRHVRREIASLEPKDASVCRTS